MVMLQTLILLAFLISLVLSAEPKIYRRCISKFVDNYSTNNVSTSTPSMLKTLHDETTCEFSFPACSKLSQLSAEATSIDPPYLAAILLLPDSNDDDFLALGGNLLIQGFHVTVYDFLRPGSENRVDYIQNKVFGQIPCKPDDKLKGALNVISAIDAAGTCSRRPLDAHMISRAPPMMDLLVMTMGYSTETISSYSDSKFRADVLIMDVYNVAGLLMADKFQIPAITIGTASSLELAIDHHPDWEPPVTLDQWSDGIYLILRQRWQSLMLTTPFMTLNSRRRKVGLGPLKRPSDYFLPVVALIIQYLPQEYVTKAKYQDYWNIIHNIGAIQPLCLPCISTYKPVSSWRHSQPSPTIMVSLPLDSSTLEATTTVLQAIILSQQMLIMRKLTPFAIVWLDFGDESVSFSASDDDFTRESSANLLDSLARHPDTVIVVGHCDSDSLVASMLGVSVFCVSQDKDLEGTPLQRLYNETHGLMAHDRMPKVLVTDYLQKHVWTKTEDGHGNETNGTGTLQEDILEFDGLSRTTTLIKKAAEIHRQNGPWNSTEEMHRTIVSELVDQKTLWRAQKKQHYDALGLLWAWSVTLITCGYICVKTFSNPSIERYFGSYIGRFDELFPDMEESFRMVENWYVQQASSEAESRVRIALRTKRTEKEKEKKTA